MAGYEKKDLNVNSRGIALYNSEEGYINSTLRCGYWNDKITIDIHPMLEKPTDKNKFDYDQKLSVILGQIDAQTLLSAIEMVVSGEHTALAIPTSKGMVEFGSSSEELGVDGYYINICETNDAKQVQNSLMYCFKKSVIISGYNYGSAEYEVIEDDSEVDAFVEFIENALDAGTMAYAHMSLERNKYSNEKMKNDLVKLMESAGISTEYAGSGSNSRRSWSSSKSTTKNDLQEKTVTSEDEIDIY